MHPPYFLVDFIKGEIEKREEPYAFGMINQLEGVVKLDLDGEIAEIVRERILEYILMRPPLDFTILMHIPY